jgi:large subunit ribosomal protein L9
MLPPIKERIVKVIFVADVPSVAKVGQTKEVANGYARNFLFPRQLAVLANSNAAAAVDAHLKKLVKQHAIIEAEMSELAKKIGGMEVTIRAKVGENDKLYGSVTGADVAEALSKAAGREIDKKLLVLAEPIKIAGVTDVTVRFMHEITAVIKVNVVDENATEETIKEQKKAKADKAAADKAAAAEEKAKAEKVPAVKAEKAASEKPAKEKKAKAEKPVKEAAVEAAKEEKAAKAEKAPAEKKAKAEKPAKEAAVEVVKEEKAASEKPAKEKKAKSEKAAPAEEAALEKAPSEKAAKEKKPKAKAKKEAE